MALTHWAFIYTADGSDPEGTVTTIDNGVCRTVLLGVPNVDVALRRVGSLVDDGAQLIELCGGFGPVGTAKIIDAIGGRVPVGSVGYGPESVDGVYAIFS